MSPPILHLLTSTKATLLTTQFLLLFLAYQHRHENIMGALSLLHHPLSPEYQSADSSLQACLIASVVLLSLTALLFITSLDLPQIGLVLVQSLFMALSCISMVWFILDSWHYTHLWQIFILGIVPVFVLSLLSTFTTLLRRRRPKMQ